MASPEEKAGYAAIVAALAALLAVIVYPEPFTLRSAAALIVGAPSAVLLGFYAVYREAKDRLYRLGLLSLILAADLVVAGLPARLAAAGFIAIVIVLVAAAALGRS